MAAIRKFFEKRRLDAKFKLAGSGRKVTEASTPTASKTKQAPPRPRKEEHRAPDEGAVKAGAAALARFEQQQQDAPSMANRSLNVIRDRAKRELEEEKKAAEMAKHYGAEPKEVIQDAAPMLAVNGVFFTCPIIGPYVLPLPEMEARIKAFLYQQLEEERGLTACLIIHTCNKNKEKVKQCVDTLCKCLTNIMENPTDEKFRKLRVASKAFHDKIAGMEGAIDFLLAAGFEACKLPHGDDQVEEDYYYFPEARLADIDNLAVLRDALLDAEPIETYLDRNPRVLTASHQAVTGLPPEFYTVTADDVKREIALKQETVDKNLMLRTKAMRERDEIREVRRYRYALLRIRFPDSFILQGTFKVKEKLTDIKAFIQEHLALPELPFILSTTLGHHLQDDEATLASMELVPSAILQFSWDPSLEIERDSVQYLNDEAILLCQEN